MYTLSWPVRLSSSSFVVMACHLRRSMYLRHLFVKLCNLSTVDLMILHVSHPYIRTDLTLLLKICNFILWDMTLVLHTGKRVLNAPMAFPILAFMSISVPPSLLTTLPR